MSPSIAEGSRSLLAELLSVVALEVSESSVVQ